MLDLAPAVPGLAAGELMIVKNISNHYVAKVKTHWKILTRAAGPVLLAWFLTGCGGVQARHSVSPASLLLPGLLKADPPTAAPTKAAPVQTAPDCLTGANSLVAIR